MPSDDPKFERALAQHLRDGSARATCADPETLAAYHERNLSPEEMARWKEHISACETCQEALALVETTENQLAEVGDEQGLPVMEAASISRTQAGSIPKLSAKAVASNVTQTAASPVRILHRRPALLRWAIPLGAVAAGVLVLIGVYEQRSQKVAQEADAVVARRQGPTTPAPMLDAEKREEQLQRESKDEGALAENMPREKTDLGRPAHAFPTPAERTRMPESGNLTVGTVVAKKVEAPPPPHSPEIITQADRDAAVSQNVPVVAAAPRPAPPPPPVAYGGGPGGAAGDRKARSDAKSAPSAVTETVIVEPAAPQADTTTSTMMMKQGVTRQKAEAVRSNPGVILTPDNKVFWKLQPAGTVQLTTDGGKNWKPIETGANTELISGVAPSSQVCWIAGKAGTLVLTTDRGRHWARISTPIAGDLGGVHAADAKHASIWDAAKETSYETSDGGATWTQSAGK